MAYFDTDYFKISDRNADGPRHADIRAVDLSDVIMYVDEPGARDLVAKLTTWLDAPRLAAREKPDVVAEFTDEFGTRTYLVRTSEGEWGVGDSHELAPVSWGDEADARDLFREVTNTDACELCGTYRDDHDVDEDGIYTCTAEHKTACEAACAKKGQ